MSGIILAVDHPRALAQAEQCIKAGRIVVIPTDTVYGVGCSLFNPERIASLYQIKSRDANKAIAVLLADPEQVNQVALDLNPRAMALARAFWPGALTLVVTKQPSIPAELSSLPTVGVRIPNHAFVRELAHRCGPLAVTSANLSGQPSSLSLADVFSQLGEDLDLYIDGGTSLAGGLSSTVVDCTGEQPVILREGPITAAEVINCWAKA